MIYSFKTPLTDVEPNFLRGINRGDTHDVSELISPIDNETVREQLYFTLSHYI